MGRSGFLALWVAAALLLSGCTFPRSREQEPEKEGAKKEPQEPDGERAPVGAAAEGQLELAFTGSPGEGMERAIVSVARVDVLHERLGLLRAVDAQKDLDLADLRGGVAESLGLADLPAGRYSEIRVTIARATVVADGKAANATIPDDAKEVRIPFSFEVRPGTKTALTIDLDADKSFTFTTDEGWTLRAELKPLARTLSSVSRVSTAQLVGISKLENLSKAPFQARFGDSFGLPAALIGRWNADPGAADAGEKARRFVLGARDAFRLGSQDSFVLGKTRPSHLGWTTVRLEQHHGGVPVFGAGLVVHVDGGDVTFVHGPAVPGLELDTTPAISADRARSIAEGDLVARVGGHASAVGEPRLVVFHPKVIDRRSDGDPSLAWQVVLRPVGAPGLWWSFVDADAGRVIRAWDNAPDSHPSEISDASTSPPTLWYDDHVCQQAPCTPPAEASLLNTYGDNYYDYLSTVFGIDSIDGNGMPLEGRVLDPGPRFGCWGCVVNDVASFNVSTVNQDRVTHEYTHGLNEKSGGSLVYQNESGAISESFGDTFAEYHNCRLAGCNWWYDRDAFGNAPALSGRNLSDPTDTGDPDHVDDFVVTTSDNGGVHTNSQIPNKVHYLIAAGGTHYGIAVTGLGLPGVNSKAELLLFRSLIDAGLSDTASFAEYRDVMVQTCLAMVEAGDAGMTSTNCQNVFKAWCSVGLCSLTQNAAAASNEDDDRFGYSMASGNFNGDAYDDLAVGVPYEDFDGNDDTGMVVVLYGSSAGLGAGGYERLGQSLSGVAVDEDADQFGLSLASGRFNADDYDDLAVGIPYENYEETDDGVVVVFLGSAAGLLPASAELLHQEVSDVGYKNEPGDRFGWTLAAGNFNGDAFDDLAVGVPYEYHEVEDDGVVIVFFGSASGLVPASAERIHQETAGLGFENEPGDRFGWSLASGDINDDDYDDLAIGAPYEFHEVADDGVAIILYGGSGGLLPVSSSRPAERIHQETSGLGFENEPGDRFGWSLATGSFNGDRFADLAVGAPYEYHEVADDGVVIVLYGSGGGLLPVPSATPVERIHQEASGLGYQNEPGDRFGWSLAAGKLTSDNVDDLVVGAPYEFHDMEDDGVAILLAGSSAGLLPSTPQRIHQETVGGANEEGDRLGFALAIGDFDGDGDADLAIAAPYEDFPGGIANGGAVYVMG